MGIKQQLATIIILLALLMSESSSQSSQKEQQSQKKVLVVGLNIASHTLINMWTAIDIQSQKKYNVTFIVNSRIAKDIIAFTKQNGVNVVVLPTYGKELNEKLTKEQNSIFQVDEVIVNSKETLQQLKREKFDILITEFQPQFQILANFMEIPVFFQIIGSMEPLNIDNHQLAPFHSSQINQGRHTYFGKALFESVEEMASSFTFRLQNFYSVIALRYAQYQRFKVAEGMIKVKYPDTYMEMIYQNRQPNLTLSFSVENVINPSIVLPQNHKFLYPKYKQQVPGEEKQQNPAVTNFISNYQNIALISFGTQLTPSPDELIEIFNFINTNKHYGFVIVIRDTYFKKFSQMNKQFRNITRAKQQNFLIQDYINQPLLLSNPKTKFFFTHGGKNSFSEALENALPVVVFPIIQTDQNMFCQYVHYQHIGQCLEEITVNNLQKALDDIEQNDYYQPKLKQWQKIMNESKNSEEHDINYWIDYSLEVGTYHLQENQNIQMNYFQINEIDVGLAFIMLLAICAYISTRLLCFLFLSIKANFFQKQNAN